VEIAMIELVFLACLRTMPAECEERSLAYLPELGPSVCMAQAQPWLAAWTEAHPGFIIARWTCREVARREIRA
jgi:hypothetical protein